MRHKQIACASADALVAVEWRGRITYLNPNILCPNTQLLWSWLQVPAAWWSIRGFTLTFHVTLSVLWSSAFVK